MDSLDALKFLDQLAKQLQNQAEQVNQWQARLQQNEENQEWQKLESLLASAQTFIFTTDDQLQIFSVQGPMTESLGWSEPEFVGRKLSELLDPTHPLKEPGLAQISEAAVTRLEVPFLTRTGVRAWCQLSLVPFQDDQGTHLGFQALACGVQEIQNRAEELRICNQQLSEQLDALQKEQQQKLEVNSTNPVEQEFWFRLRSALRTIILRRMRSIFTQAGASEYALHGLAFGIDFLENLLRFEVKPESWRELEEFEPSRLFDSCRGLFQNSKLGRGPADAWSGAFVGPIRVWQAFLLELFACEESIFCNAETQLALNLDPQRLELTTTAQFPDESPIEDYLRRTRQHFSRLKRLSEACRGELTVRKDSAPNQIQIVFSLTGGVPSDLPGPVPPPQEPHHYSILVAEDDEIAKRVVVTLLQKLGHQVQAVSGGLDVLDLLNVQEFDVVMLDLEMPDLDGISTARQVLSRFHPPPYLIALTAGNSASIRRQVMEAGMHDFLSKPLRSDDLNDALSQVHVHRLGRDSQS